MPINRINQSSQVVSPQRDPEPQKSSVGTVEKYHFKHPLLNKELKLTEHNLEEQKQFFDRVISESKPKKNFLNKIVGSVVSWAADKTSKLYHTFIWSGIKDVRKSVEQYGGTVDFKFSQVKGGWFGELFANPKTRYGACYASSLCWLWKKSNNEDLFGLMYEGRKKSKLNSEWANFIKSLQIALEPDDDGDKNTPKALSLFDFQQAEECINEENSQKELANFLKSGNKLSLQEMERLIEKFKKKKDEKLPFVQRLMDEVMTPRKENNSRFKVFSVFSEERGGHSMAIDIQDNSVEMFDPIFGLFKFDDKETFKKWFCEAFWEKSCYGSKIPGLDVNFDDRFEIMNLEKIDNTN